LLETLTIFGLRANYMASFREYLRENDDLQEWEKIQLEIFSNESFFKYGLVLPTIRKGKDFSSEDFLALKPDSRIRPLIDLIPRIQLRESQERAVDAEEGVPDAVSIPANLLPLFDWDRVYFEILEHKALKEYWNVHITREALQAIISGGHYTLRCPPVLLDVKTFDGLRKLEDVVLLILKKYLDKFYVSSRKKWEDDNREAAPLVKDSPGFSSYTISVKKDRVELMEKIRTLIKQMEREFREDKSANGLKFIHFDRHLYQPLLRLKKSDHIKVDPAALDESGGDGEGTFIEDLKAYVKEHRQELKGKEIFVLRNLPHRGVGFYDTPSFYPDFIIWVKEKKKQRIIFVDPKGIHHFGPEHPKLRLHERLREIEAKLNRPNVSLDAYIVSTTKLEAMQTQGWPATVAEWATGHVLFQDNKDYVQRIFA
jgi:hypothetical protein